MTELGQLQLVQGDGGPPTTVAAGSAPGESGISVLGMRFRDSAHLGGTSRRHLVCFQLSPQARFHCRIADRTRRHDPLAGSLAICPAGVDFAADADASFDGIIVAIEPDRLALAAAEDSSLEAQLIERFSGYDEPLLAQARALTLEAGGNYPSGPLFWNEIASELLDGLVAGHTSGVEVPARGTLGKDVLERLREYIVAHLDEPIQVTALARVAGRSPFHFSRIFARSVGVTPHQYVVRLRLRRAVELVRDGRSGLAEIAMRTGFADQSHLSRWIRRVYGVSPTQLVA